MNCTALNNLTIGSNVTEIASGAFKNCTALTKVVIPDKVTTIGSSVFQKCEYLTDITLGSSVTSIGAEAFDFQGTYVAYGTYTVIREVTFHCKSLTPPTLASNSFPSNSDPYQNPYRMHKVYVPTPYALSLYQAAPYWSNFLEGRYFLDQRYDFKTGDIYYLISGTNTVKVTNKYGGRIPGIASTNDYSYTGSVTIPTTAYDSRTEKTYNVTAIGYGAFNEDRQMNKNSTGEAPSLRDQGDLKSVTMGSSVQAIEDYAFYNCTGLTTVTLGSNVTSIGEYAFKGCTSLAEVKSYRYAPPTIQSTTFDSNHYSSTTVKVPSTNAVNSYKAANYWKNFYLIIPNGGELNYALNVSGGNINFTSTGDYPWTVMGDGTRIYAQSSNAGVASSSSAMTATVAVTKASTVSFDFKAWGEGTSYDKCIFSIDGNQVFSYGARQNDWETFTADLPTGTHTLTWTYQKDGSVNPEGDYFAVDNVAITEKPVSTGDVDGDGQVNIADVTALIDLLLAGTTPPAAADVDGDGKVNIADVTALIDMLLSR